MQIRLLAIFFGLLGCFTCALAAEHDPTPAQMREDLEFMKTEWVGGNKWLTPSERKSAVNQLDDLIARADELSVGEFVMGIMKVNAVQNNAHTLAALGYMETFDRLPLRFWRFSDGLYVVKTHPDYTKYLGAKVEFFGGDVTADDAFSMMKEYVAGNDSWKTYLATVWLDRPDMLHALGLTRDPGRVYLTLRLQDGSGERAAFPAVSEAVREYVYLQPWKEAIHRTKSESEAEPESPDRAYWPHVLDPVEERPAYLSRDDRIFYELMPEFQAAYMRVERISNFGEPGSLELALFDLMESLSEDEPQNAILDLRYNQGGNFLQMVGFSQALPKFTSDDGKIFILVNRATFSAALVTIDMIVKHAGRHRVVLVGEPVGDFPQFRSEGDHVILPHSGIYAVYSTGRHDLVDGCEENEECWWGARVFETGMGAIEPDIRIKEAYADYVSGRDLYLEAIARALK
jgi:hypothetical protein